jgi:hypothetical protein
VINAQRQHIVALIAEPYVTQIVELQDYDIVTSVKYIVLSALTVGMNFMINIIMAKKSSIPGLSFSWKRALGVTKAKQQIARKTGIPTTKAGLERKIGNTIIKSLFGKK